MYEQYLKTKKDSRVAKELRSYLNYLLDSKLEVILQSDRWPLSVCKQPSTPDCDVLPTAW